MDMLRPGADAIAVPMDQRHVACPTHAEPLRATWPLGWDVFASIVAGRALESPMLQTGVADPRYWDQGNLRWGDLPSEIGPARIRAMLEERPACEWVEPGTLLAAYHRSGVGRSGICRLCHVLRQGTPYGVVSGRGHDVIPHVCFACVATGRIRA